MKQPRLLIGFKQYSDAKLNQKTSVILSSMTGNAYFPKPTPALSTIQNNYKNFQDALDQARTKLPEKVTLKNNMRKALTDNLVKLAAWVEYISQGDLVKLQSSGFDVSKTSDSTKKLGDVKNFQVMVGKVSGSATLTCDKVDHAVFYNFYWQLQSAAAGSPWFHDSNTKPICTFTGIPPLQIVCFKITAAGRNSIPTTSSEIITKGVV